MTRDPFTLAVVTLTGVAAWTAAAFAAALGIVVARTIGYRRHRRGNQ
jgi:hypothetical protein